MSQSAARFWALEMARRGFPVFPLQPDSKLPFIAKECEPKHRAFAGGIHRATTDETLIESWFDRDPAINYGIATANLVVIDADAADGKPGLETLKSFGKLPATLAVRTARGGLHVVFNGPGTNARQLGPGVDVRSTGGYIVGPGSTFQGKPYAVFLDAPLAELPAPLRARLEAPTRPQINGHAFELPAALDLAVAHVKAEPGAVKGGRGIAAYRLAAQLKDLGVSEPEALELLAGHWAPRCDPPLAADEMVEVAHAYQYGRNVPGCSNPLVEFEPVPRELAAPAPAGGFKFLDVRRGPDAIPRRPWLVPGLLMHGALTGLVAPPAAGKSTFVLALAIGMALGRLDWLGLELKTQGPRKVVLVNNEDDEDELLRRLYAICRRANLPWPALERQIIIHDDRAGGFLAFKRDPKSRQLLLEGTKRFKEFEAVLARHDPVMWSVDPFVETHEGNENDNAEVAAVLRQLRTLAHRHRSAGLIVHHTRKPPQAASDSYAGDPNAARGSSAFLGNVRALATLYTMGLKDAQEYGISLAEHRSYTRLDMGKGSYSPPGAATRWFKTVSVELENGDNAPAIEPAKLTSQADRLRGDYHRVLATRALLGGLTYEEAAELIENDMMLEQQTAKQLAKRLQELFGVSVTIDGVALVANEAGVRAWRE